MNARSLTVRAVPVALAAALLAGVSLTSQAQAVRGSAGTSAGARSVGGSPAAATSNTANRPLAGQVGTPSGSGLTAGTAGANTANGRVGTPSASGLTSGTTGGTTANGTSPSGLTSGTGATNNTALGTPSGSGLTAGSGATANTAGTPGNLAILNADGTVTPIPGTTVITTNNGAQVTDLNAVNANAQANNAAVMGGPGVPATPQSTPGAGPGPYTAQQLASSFLQADANRDGDLTRAEATRLSIMASSFEEMDRNKDGILSRSEYEDGSR